MFETSAQAIDKADRVDSFKQMVETLESQMPGIDARLKNYQGVLLRYSENVHISGEMIDALKKTIWYDKIFPLDKIEKLANELKTPEGSPRDCLEISSKDLEWPPKELPKYARYLHAAIGCVTESAELIGRLIHTIYTGKPIDKTNIIEELGDQLFYIQMMGNVIGVDLYEIMRVNQAKLAKRYGEKLQFSSEAAINRDHEKERQVMESEHQQQ